MQMAMVIFNHCTLHMTAVLWQLQEVHGLTAMCTHYSQTALSMIQLTVHRTLLLVHTADIPHASAYAKTLSCSALLP